MLYSIYNSDIFNTNRVRISDKTNYKEKCLCNFLY